MNLKYSYIPLTLWLVTVIPQRPGISTERLSNKAEFSILREQAKVA